MEIILSTHNVSKALQIQAIFDGSDIYVRTLDVSVPKDLEDGTTLEENAFKKAWFAHENSESDTWTMADDTGLFITTLDGEPGVRSARWLGEGASIEETQNYCITRMEGIDDRSATFRTVVVAISPEGTKHVFAAEAPGSILKSPRVAPHPMMPYSAIHVPDGQELSWAEMSIEQENAISHRGKAFMQLRSFLETL
jgi:XTP/dITP diphosphohydrolase